MSVAGTAEWLPELDLNSCSRFHCILEDRTVSRTFLRLPSTSGFPCDPPAPKPKGSAKSGRCKRDAAGASAAPAASPTAAQSLNQQRQRGGPVLCLVHVGHRAPGSRAW